MAIPKQKLIMKTRTEGMVVDFNKDGSRLLVATNDYLFCFNSAEEKYDLINCKTIITGESGKFVTDMRIGPDGDLFAYSTLPSYSVHVGSIYDEEFEMTLNYYNDVLECRSKPDICSVRFSSCGKFLLCGGYETVGCIYIFDLEAAIQKDRMKAHFDRECHINVAEYIGNSPNIFVTGDVKGLIHLWDSRSKDKPYRSPVSVFHGHSSEISYIDSRHDDTYILSSSAETINIHDLRRPSTNYRFFEREKISDNLIDMTYYNPNNNNMNNNSIMMQKNDRFLSGEIRAKYSPIEQMGQRYIYTGCGSGRIIIYDVLTGEVERILKGRRCLITDATWHPKRNEIVSTCSCHVNLNTIYQKTDSTEAIY